MALLNAILAVVSLHLLLGLAVFAATAVVLRWFE